MKCFYHTDRDAVALCRNCYRGLCRDCFADSDEGMVCKDGCGDKRDHATHILARHELWQSLGPLPVQRIVLGGVGLTAAAFTLLMLSSWLPYVLIPVGVGAFALSYHNYSQKAVRLYRVIVPGTTGIAALVCSMLLINSLIGYVTIPVGAGLLALFYYMYSLQSKKAGRGDTVIEHEEPIAQ